MIRIYNNGKLSTVGNGKQMDGSKVPGDLTTWDFMGTDPNDLLTYSYKTLSERATTLFHTHAPVAAAVNKQTNYAIGPGLVFRSQPDWQILDITKEYAKDWGMRFQKLVHYTSLLLNFYEKQSLIFRTALIMGDSLLMFDRKEPNNGLPFDLIETGGDQIDWRKSEADKYTLGVKHDSLLRRKGVFLNSGKDVDFVDENNDQNVIQFYLKNMARQLRGLPLSYKIIAAAKNNDRWWDATLARAVLESVVMGSATKQNSAEDASRQAEFLANASKGETGASSTALNNLANTNDIAPGSMFSFTGDAEIKFSDLKTPSNNFDKLQSAYIDIVGMATDTPPEVVMSKYSTSFTAHKGAFNDFIMSYMAKRKTFIKTVCQPTIKEIAKYLFLSGLIEMPHPAFFTNAIVQMATLTGNYLGPVPKHINPLQEVNAKVVAKNNAFSLPSDYANENGYEWEDFIQQWQYEQSEWQSMNPDKQAVVLSDDMEEKDDNGDFEDKDIIEKDEDEKDDKGDNE